MGAPSSNAPGAGAPRPVVPLIGPANFHGPLDMRDPEHLDRRNDERRSNGPGRRPEDLAAVRTRYWQAAFAVTAGIGALISAAMALFHPPITRRVSELCGDGLGGQVIVHRGLSWLWIPAMLGIVLAVVLPHRRQRPILTLFCAGLVIGMATGAFLRVETVVSGLCLA